MKNLTEKQKTILQFIVEFIDSNGNVPTGMEVSNKFSILPNAAYCHIKQIANKGYLKLTPKIARGLVIVKDKL